MLINIPFPISTTSIQEHYMKTTFMCPRSMVGVPFDSVRRFRALFVCLFVGIKPEKLYSTSCVGREVKPLGAVTHGKKHMPRACPRQRHTPRTHRLLYYCTPLVCVPAVIGVLAVRRQNNPKKNLRIVGASTLSHS